MSFSVYPGLLGDGGSVNRRNSPDILLPKVLSPSSSLLWVVGFGLLSSYVLWCGTGEVFSPALYGGPIPHRSELSACRQRGSHVFPLPPVVVPVPRRLSGPVSSLL